MTINFHGEGCFKIQSGDLTILTDPLNENSGLKAPRFKADLILKTLTPLPISSADREPRTAAEEFSIVGPGEYNFKNADVSGFLLTGESTKGFFKTVYLLELEGIKICLMGHISDAPDPALLERVEETDILIIPAGGRPFLEQKSAVNLIGQMEPKIIIPSFFKVSGLKRSADDIKKFLDELNHKQKTENAEKLTVKKKDLSEIKSPKVVVLEN